MKKVVIELQNVKKIYKMEGVETHALRGVDLKIRKNDKSKCNKRASFGIQYLQRLWTRYSI